MSYLQLAQPVTPAGGPAAAVARTPVETSKALTAEQIAAMRLLNLSGTRIIRQGSQFLVGIWEDLDCPELRRAISLVGMRDCPVVHLDTANVDTLYKVRRCPDRRPGETFTSWLKRAEQAKTLAVALYEGISA